MATIHQHRRPRPAFGPYRATYLLVYHPPFTSSRFTARHCPSTTPARADFCIPSSQDLRLAHVATRLLAVEPAVVCGKQYPRDRGLAVGVQRAGAAGPGCPSTVNAAARKALQGEALDAWHDPGAPVSSGFFCMVLGAGGVTVICFLA
ncbi:hypothetical protein B0H10DRAFT_2442097 [Mycena sp. CBHHK59/15]|nr:hypothetical protein B0H10DRAFT_2442097 [Mycena sp. CBHHK59/15]